MGAGGAGCFNMWYDRDIDAVMERTTNRVVPSGKVGARNALIFSCVLMVSSIGIIYYYTNILAAVLLTVSIFIYVVIYTIWLKRRSVHNIVIGGASGAMSPMIGWAATSGELSYMCISMSIIIFLWTPAHFWPLSIVLKEEYEHARVPMLPVICGIDTTRKKTLIYSILTAISSLIPYVLGLSIVYGIASLILGIIFVYMSALMNKCIVRDISVFLFSIAYAFFLFLLMIIDFYL